MLISQEHFRAGEEGGGGRGEALKPKGSCPNNGRKISSRINLYFATPEYVVGPFWGKEGAGQGWGWGRAGGGAAPPEPPPPRPKASLVSALLTGPGAERGAGGGGGLVAGSCLISGRVQWY